MTGDLPVPRAPASVLDGLTPGQRRAAIRHLIENLGAGLRNAGLSQPDTRRPPHHFSSLLQRTISQTIVRLG
ncbi:hypothetical protein FMA36_16855 (plasmid) [Komagataeibacter xylinus]|uniref:Uncharacterized protein n=1 Tax=Komagataeibacter xylinus TaxID=28448 RepID=A0A857FV33_KOMXY|nr:hypothetical protein FMA36_16855 [Komagataeibacter xylinus]